MQDTEQKAKRAKRRDADERRTALIDAATACFRESGYLVPLEEIAARAHVGRGTLYRNFKDRLALALAVFDRQVDALEGVLDPSTSLEDALAELLRRGALGSALFARLAAEMPIGADNVAAFEAIGARSLRVIAPMVERARATGLLAPDMEPGDVLIAARMVSGLLRQHMSAEEVDAQIALGLRMVMNGLRPR